MKCRYCGEILDPAMKRRRQRRARAEVPWYRKAMVGLLGWGVLYMLTRAIIGGILGGIAGGRHPDNWNDGIAEGLRNFEDFMRHWHAVIIFPPCR